MIHSHMTVKTNYSQALVSAYTGAGHIWPVKNLRRIRSERKLSQTKLAEMADVSQSTISKLESGDLNATLDKIIAIAKALKIEPQELFDLPELQARALSAIGRIPPEQREAALVVLEAMAVPKRPAR